MPPAPRLRPADLAAEAKQSLIPYVEELYTEKHPPIVRKYTHLPPAGPLSMDRWEPRGHLRITVIEGDPVDVALDWAEYINSPPIPVVLAANERRPGGDWETAIMAPEECLSRRSNLVRCLGAPPEIASPTPQMQHDGDAYPIPSRGGLYCPNVVVFRYGPDLEYRLMPEFYVASVIAVTPLRRPKLRESGPPNGHHHPSRPGGAAPSDGNEEYSFTEEAETMREKIRTVMRIAAKNGQRRLCVGAFGQGSVYRNPAVRLGEMWRDLLFKETEFAHTFDEVAFAFDWYHSSVIPGPNGSNGRNGNGHTGNVPDLAIFREIFDPVKICEILTNQRRQAFPFQLGEPRPQPAPRPEPQPQQDARDGIDGNLVDGNGGS